eukprot:3427377-Amphidinium_carterae.1
MQVSIVDQAIYSCVQHVCERRRIHNEWRTSLESISDENHLIHFFQKRNEQTKEFSTTRNL